MTRRETAAVSHLLQARQHRLTVVQMILLHPLANLAFVRIELGALGFPDFFGGLKLEVYLICCS